MLYGMLHNAGQPEPDTIAFMREAAALRCCHLVQLPCALYEQALVRHFLFDEAEAVRFELLRTSANTSLAAFARKFAGEITYHTLHGRAILKRLCTSTQEARTRVEQAFALLYPYCQGIFEPSPYEDALIASNIYVGEAAAQAKWHARIAPFVAELGLAMPPFDGTTGMGGRHGNHTTELAVVLAEMSEVFRLDPTAQW